AMQYKVRFEKNVTRWDKFFFETEKEQFERERQQFKIELADFETQKNMVEMQKIEIESLKSRLEHRSMRLTMLETSGEDVFTVDFCFCVYVLTSCDSKRYKEHLENEQKWKERFAQLELTVERLRADKAELQSQVSKKELEKEGASKNTFQQ
ncbi:trichohyalin, partial [Reticulomyxa filosa]